MTTRHPRLAFACTIVGAWLLALIVRLYGLQILDHDRYAERAVDQQQAVVELAAPRGTIRDARGRELAVSLEVDSIYADPRELRAQDGEPEAVAGQLAEILGLSEKAQRDLAERLASERRFTWVARKPDPPQAAAVMDAELPGIHRVAESRRYYPLRALGAQVLGFVGIDDVGLSGIEAMYDKVVRSRPGRRVVVSDGRAGRIRHPRLGFTAAHSGSDLTLTLDIAVQHALESELAKAVAHTQAKQATGVVLDPHTGAVIAMAGVPTFDPNRFQEYPEKQWRNPVIADAFEPGSTFKLITLAAALERGVTTLDRVWDCEMGVLRLQGVPIRDHKPFGMLSTREVLAKSSNVGAMKLGRAAGREAFYGTMRAFGIGRPTGIDLPGENTGLLRPIERWRALTPAYMSFGQGLSTTTLQMAVVFATVANGGFTVRPYVVAATDGKPISMPRGIRVLRTETVAKLRDALESVVIEGTATPAQVAGYRVAGKTGTAQKAIRGGYAKSQFVASFIGMVPVDDPELVIAVVVDEPWPLYHGSQAAAPAFAEIARAALLYRGVTPDRELPETWPGQQTVAARFDDAAPIVPELASMQQASARLAPRSEPRPTPPGTVPDLVTLNKRDAVRAATGKGLELRLYGSGYVERQVPAAGTPLDLAGPTLELWFGPTLPTAVAREGP